jgi:hypothetical protein
VQLNKQSWRELEKLYPIRIPILDHAEYYVSLLRNDPNYSFLEEALQNAADAQRSMQDIGKCKMKLMDEIVSRMYSEDSLISGRGYLGNPEDLEEISVVKPLLTLPKEEGHFLSIDMVSAGWQALLKMKGISFEPFSDYVKREFNAHPFFAESKSFRQLVLGNMNPKAQQAFQKSVLSHLVLSLQRTENTHHSSDEVIIPVSREVRKDSYSVTGPYIFRNKRYVSNEVTSMGEKVTLEHDYEDGVLSNPRLKGVSGNRYYIHYKRVIMNEEIEERDLFFKNDNHLAKWII